MSKPLNKSDELDKLDEIQVKLVDQFITLENKLRHKEIDIERVFEMGRLYHQQARDAILDLLASQPKPDIKWPEKKSAKDVSVDAIIDTTSKVIYKEGYNAGIDACIEAVELAYGAGKRSHNIKLRKGKTVA